MYHALQQVLDSQLLQNGPMVVFLWQNAPGWPVLSVSPNLQSLLGQSPLAFTSGALIYSDQIHPEDRVRVLKEVKRASEERTCNAFTHAPYRYRHTHGHYLWLKDTTTIVRDEEGAITHYVGYLFDITPEITMQQETRFLKERLDLAMQATMDGLWDWNIQSGEVYFSPQWKAMLGFADEELGNTLDTWKERVHPDDLSAVHHALEAHLHRKTQQYRSEHRMRCKNGHYRWVLDRGVVVERDDTGKALRMIGTHADIEQRKHEQHELEKSRRRFMEISQISTDWIWEIDAQGRYTFVSERVVEVLGYAPEEMLGKSPLVFMSSQEAARVGERFMEHFAKHTPFRDLENINLHRDGHSVILQTSAMPIFEEDGSFTGYRGTDRDVTKERLAHEILQRSEHELS